MSRRYYYTETDVKKQRDVNARVLGMRAIARPFANRKGPRYGGAGSVAGGMAMLTGGVPAAAMDGAAVTATPGRAVGAAKILRWEQDNDGNIIEPPVSLEDAGVTKDAYNFSKTTIRASSTEPVLVTGITKKIGDSEVFVITNVMDFRALPGYAEGTAAVVADTQIPHHIGGSEDFKLDAEEC